LFHNQFNRQIWQWLRSNILSLRLTLRKPLRKCNRVTPSRASFYATWRQRCGVVPALHEGDGPPPERVLQGIWQQQRLRRERLRTLDGKSVRILHPGFLSQEGGPDFRGAVIQFDEQSPVTGDIEVDLEAAGWRGHGHDRNPHFRGVVLHVIWRAPRTAVAGPPAVAVADAVDAPLLELAAWLGGEGQLELPAAFRGKCSAPLRVLPESALTELLLQAALVRMRGKAAQFAARAREAGWEQSLWEGLFRALGYKHNPWPMLRLAEMRSRWLSPSASTFDVQARLLGIANLLPPELTRTRPETDGYLRRLWDRWWRERDEFADCQLPRSLWRLHGIRPGNHPQRRLALAAHWMTNGDLVGALEDWCGGGLQGEARRELAVVAGLAKILRPRRDDFWSTHLTLNSAAGTKPQALLGEARVTDLAVNVILPWLAARASEGRNAALAAQLETCYAHWPAGEDNAVLKLARQRLLGGSSPKLFRTAASQQGLLQVVRDFCDASNAICDGCRFPELVKAWLVQ
jgi:hypothetical protein